MLWITIPESEFYDERKNEFIYLKKTTLQLEHSLVSLSKWESRWNKPFLTKDEKTAEETLDYIKCMTITQNVKDYVYYVLTRQQIDTINDYIDAPMTATTFSKTHNMRKNREIVTAEIIYYWMVTLNIPFECQKWHLNRLLTLINVCNIKNEPSKKMGRREIMNQNRNLNAQRRRALKTKG